MIAGRANDAPKLIFVNRYFRPDESATSQMLTDLATALAHSGAKVHVICSRQLYDRAGSRLPPRETLDAVQVHRVWTTRFGRGSLLGRAADYATFYLSSAFAMQRLLRRGDTVIAKTDPPLMSIVAMLAAKMKRAHLINWLQDVFPEVASSLGANPLPNALNSLLRGWRNSSLRFALVNVVLGERMRDELLGMDIPAGQIQIIENWAQRDPGPPLPVGASALRSRLGLGEKFVVGYSGNLGRAHEFQTLLGAAEQLRDDLGIAFLMIGGGSGMAQLAREVRARNLGNFHFLPYQPREELADALAAADVHWVSLLPELEGFIVPSKFYGILAAGRPVIFIGDLDGELAREIKASGCGASIAIGQARELTQLLSAWQADAQACERMGRLAYRRYSDRFCAQRGFAQWLEILTPPNRAGGVLSPIPLRQ